jgi:hypothetical protein
MKTFLPRWLRQWAALLLAEWDVEIGGMLHDYANGKWELLHMWKTKEGAWGPHWGLYTSGTNPQPKFNF